MRDAIKWAAITASLLGTLAAPAAAATGTVTVIRGNASEAAAGRQGARAPTVLRGLAPEAKPTQPAPETSRVSADWIATAGDNLWFVERHGGRVIGCWMQESTQVGEIDIRCGQTSLD
jgi:hypothetical protein